MSKEHEGHSTLGGYDFERPGDDTDDHGGDSAPGPPSADDLIGLAHSVERARDAYLREEPKRHQELMWATLYAGAGIVGALERLGEALNGGSHEEREACPFCGIRGES